MCPIDISGNKTPLWKVCQIHHGGHREFTKIKKLRDLCGKKLSRYFQVLFLILLPYTSEFCHEFTRISTKAIRKFVEFVLIRG